MKRHSIQNADGTLFLNFIPELGGAISSFFVKNGADGNKVDLMRPAPEGSDITVLDASSFPLTPFSNRIAQGQFGMKGKTYVVGPNFRDEPHPNHGDGWTSVWTLEDLSQSQAKLSIESGPKQESPYVYRAEQTYAMNKNGLEISMMIENRGKEALPFGLGHHPYFPRTSDVVFKANLSHIWHSKVMIPTTLHPVPTQYDFSNGRTLDTKGLGEPVNGFDGTAYLDHCFQGWDRKADISWPGRKASLHMEADPLFSHFVLFVPQDNFFCAEPVSHATDAFNLADRGIPDVGLTILEPGQNLQGKMRFTYAQG